MRTIHRSPRKADGIASLALGNRPVNSSMGLPAQLQAGTAVRTILKFLLHQTCEAPPKLHSPALHRFRSIQCPVLYFFFWACRNTCLGVLKTDFYHGSNVFSFQDKTTHHHITGDSNSHLYSSINSRCTEREHSGHSLDEGHI